PPVASELRDRARDERSRAGGLEALAEALEPLGRGEELLRGGEKGEAPVPQVDERARERQAALAVLEAHRVRLEDVLAHERDPPARTAEQLDRAREARVETGVVEARAREDHALRPLGPQAREVGDLALVGALRAREGHEEP